MIERNGNSRDLNGLRALVAEDDFHIAFVIETALEAAGIEVVDTVSRVDEGLKIARSEKPDIAVVDIRLGESSSYPLVRQLRDAGTKVVLATGTEPNSHMEIELSGIHVVRKPYTVEQLVDAIRNIV